ncbi:MAG: alpha/beta hydrolase [Phycisphaerales bacterium]|nr:alpha/beta hydrolase [Phycisphaerae bacterium]NNF42431.1 alpha/beta hydrolase [Phycisphaerales bacterium]NNM26925.1 alpha/beta hydrolase [Phycisphaerales bacterium]
MTTVATFDVDTPAGVVPARLEKPPQARGLLVFGHGAGAGMHHAFMEAMAAHLSAVGIATLRYAFPYMHAGRRRPDASSVLTGTVAAAIERARAEAGTLPLFAGGKSMGGRMTSLCMSEDAIESVRGLIFFGFPLHPAGKPGIERAAHLASVAVPMLFLQGTRDRLAELDLLRPVLADLPRAVLHEVEGADHGFAVLKRSGRTDGEVLEELATATRSFVETHR